MLRRRQLSIAAAATITCPHFLLPARAWCGGYFPGKITNEWDEMVVPWQNGDGNYKTDIFVRIVNPPRRRVYGSTTKEFKQLPDLPAVLVIGCPGVPHDYCENLECIAISGRRVIAVETCEAPIDRERRSWMPPAPDRGPREMRRPHVAGSQIFTVCKALGLQSVHVFARTRPVLELHPHFRPTLLVLCATSNRRHVDSRCCADGLGSAAALHFTSLLAQARQGEEATLTDGIAVAEATSKEAARAVAADGTMTAVPPTTLALPQLASLALASPYGSIDDLRPVAARRIRDAEDFFPIDYEGSDGGFASEGQQCVTDASLLTGQPWREALLRATRAESDAERLGGRALASRLPAAVPTLLCCGGSADVVDPSWDLSGRRDITEIQYRFSGHLPFIDRREEFLIDLLDFFDGVDGVQTPRTGISDGRSGDQTI